MTSLLEPRTTGAEPVRRHRQLPPLALAGAGVLGGVLVGALVGTGSTPLVLVGVTVVLGVFAALLRGRLAVVLPVLALTLACMPPPIAFPFLISFGGKSVYFTDLLLPAATLLALTRRSRVPRLDLLAWVYSAVMVMNTAVGLVNSQPFNAFTQDLRGPVYIVCGYFIASRLFTRQLTRTVLGASGFVLWYSAGLMMATIATGVDLLAGRTEDVRAYESTGAEVIDATRFIVDSKGLAFMALVAASVVLLSDRTTRLQRRVALALAVPALVVSFLNYARATLLALAVCAVLVLLLRRAARIHGRRVAVAGLVVAGLVGLIGVTGTVSLVADPEGNVLARQVAGFNQRVLGGLGTEDVASPGNTYRLLENQAALRAIETNPVFGKGIGAVFKPRSFGDPALDAFQEDPAFGVRFIHNGWLWYLVKTGIVGLLAFLALLVVPVARTMRLAFSGRSRVSPADLGLAISVAGLLVIFVFEPDVHRVGTAPLIGAVLGYLCLLVSPRTPAEAGSTIPTTTAEPGTGSSTS